MDNIADSTILALDIGAARIGLALAHRHTKLAQAHGTLTNDSDVINNLRSICEEEAVSQLVIGLPRGLDGKETTQTKTVRAFGADLGKALGLPVAWQDEAVTSLRAEEELQARRKPYGKADIDALAATYILEDYVRENL